jgi:hypothetical protein
MSCLSLHSGAAEMIRVKTPKAFYCPILEQESIQ